MSKGFEGAWRHFFDGHGAWGIESESGRQVCYARREEHARLIAEAGTVLHETGLAPRQLASQRAELLEALKWAMPLAVLAIEHGRMERIRCGHSDITGTYKSGETWAGIHQFEVDDIEKARAAIANATQQRNTTGGEG